MMRIRCLRAFVVLVALAIAATAGVRVASAARIVENLYAAKLIDERTGWVVGAFGAIFRTTDGGVTWESQPTPTLDYLFAVDFTSPTHGVVVGKSGVVLTTEDGGQTWVQRDSGTDRNLFSVAYASPTHLWAVGDWGAVIESTDGGATWKDRTLPEDVVLTSQSWPDEQTGYIAGEFGTVQKTTDGGRTFAPVSTETDKTIFGIAFPSPSDGWAVGIDGLVLRTKDGGQTWTPQRGRLDAGSLEQLGFMEAMKNPGLYDVRLSGDYGFIVGDIGTVLVSSDRGETWQERKLPADMSLFWLRGVSSKDGRAIVVGANGLAVTVDKGEIRLKGEG
ncbi:MAG: YCF48-related protein [Thermodesulfobacteriota bacterium]